MMTIFMFVALHYASYTAGRITPELAAELAGCPAGEKIPIVVHLSVPYPDLSESGLSIGERALVIKHIAGTSQAPVIDFLSGYPGQTADIRRFWIFNGFRLKATPLVIAALAGRDDVWFVMPDKTIALDRGARSGAAAIEAVEWNVQKVMADSCWVAGYTGDSVLVGHLDTGVDFTHPALTGKFSGWWRDLVNGNLLPYDDQGHGTHTAGVLCGGDGLGAFGDDIGVAPGARLVVAKVFDQYGSAQLAWLDSAMQWMADLKADSGVDIRAVSNSWGSSSTTEIHWWTFCAVWKSLNILPVFSVGSSGPGSGTAGVPGNYPLCLAVGATDNADNIASFSSRGPAPNQNPWNDTTNWYRPDWGLTKPDLAAPGVNIRSSNPGGGYSIWSGTSMSCPHVAGAAAILCEANPAVSIAHLYNCLLDNADHPYGYTYPNNNYGWGRLNIKNALRSLSGVQDERSAKARAYADPVTVFPVPARKEIFFRMPSTLRLGGIYSADGRPVRGFDRVENRIRFVNVPAGIYFLEFKDGRDRPVVKKIVVSE